MFDEVSYLIKCGVDFDLAWSMAPDERLAYVIRFGELDGGKFDWDEFRWLTHEEMRDRRDP
jgi:hypothetical protein